METARSAQSKTGIFHGYDVAEAPLMFQAGLSVYMYSSLSLFVSFAHLEFPSAFL
jgi:hypothetical protein